MWWRRLRYGFALIAISTLATCPIAYRRCSAVRKTAEATTVLRYLVERVAAYHREHHALPPLAAGPTPAPSSCCEGGGECAAEPARWGTPGWRALAFTVDGPHRYSYSYSLEPGGTRALVRATGDLDCDGVFGVYQAELTIAAGDAHDLNVAWTRTNPTE